jgi:hypothetical protein
MKRHSSIHGFAGRYQSGVVTIFTAVMILVLLTLMVFFGMRVGVFEQRVSANEVRQKDAFHVAESGIHFGKEFLRANLGLITSDTVDLLADGTDGWLAAGGHWRRCVDAPVSMDLAEDEHPCYAVTATLTDSDGSRRRDNLYYFVEDLSVTNADEALNLPLDAAGEILPSATETVDVYALLCILRIEEGAEQPVRGCTTNPQPFEEGDELVEDGRYFMVTLLARGQADCDGNGVGCRAEALISEQVSNYGAGSGGNAPAVPLTVKSEYTPSGAIGVVANPNAGGLGVPGSVWSGSGFDPSKGSWQTCELNEWYGAIHESIPEGVECQTNCKCDDGETLTRWDAVAKKLEGGDDLIVDPQFPDDLFQFYFGVPGSQYQTIKGTAQILSSCAPLVDLGQDAFGIYWIEGGSGSQCKFDAGDTIGSPENPVLLITAAETTSFGGGAKIFGTVFSTIVEHTYAGMPEPNLVLNGTGAIYGALLVETNFESRNQPNATFDVVWNEAINRKAASDGGLGRVLGGWSDFHEQWTFEKDGS